jgi:tRNA-splicing ligase RtcB
MYVVNSEKLPIKIWATDLEDVALEQAKNLANLPFAVSHIALMPDAHFGYGACIGSVFATISDVIIPSAVGLDIGCGMLSCKTSLTELSTENLKKIMGKIRELVPVGFSHHKKPVDKMLMPELEMMEESDTYDFSDFIVYKEYKSALTQLGTLGSGNHFIEIQKGSDGHIWFMIHSGSRNLGKKVADHYNKKAAEYNEQWYSSVPKEHQLAFLTYDCPEYNMYLDEMNYCIEFALANRGLIAKMIIHAFADVVGGIAYEEPINIAHNYAILEHHFGKNVMVHRKGATLARKDTTGIIPGSQGTASYIVKGRGNTDSFTSCSHGAGRKMGRKAASKQLDLESEKKRMDDQGIIHSIRNASDLDEAPGAYKSIDEVMANQSDLVEILVELSPLGCIKG